jgi:hypothetical protein
LIKLIIKANHLTNDRDYLGAELTLPSDKNEILETLDRARVPYGSGEYRLVAHKDSPDFITKMLGGKAGHPSLSEMNHLAERYAQMDEDERCKLEGVLQIRKSYEAGDAINATHNLHRFVQHPVFDDTELGEIAIDSDGMYEPLSTVSEELLACLDPAKVGALVRKQDNGAFTNAGYVYAEDDGWDEAYDGKSLAGRSVTLEPGNPVISLLLSIDDFACGEHEGEWLHCPASQESIDAVVKAVGARSIDECHFHEVKCAIPALVYPVLYATDIQRINMLAEMVKARCGTGAELVKYKAACEMEDVKDIETAMTLTTRLDEYDFEPSTSITAFGRAAMEKTGADIKTMEEYGFDFNAYGWKAMNEQDIRYLSYGFISHPRGQELEHTPEPEQAMAGM